MNSFVLRMKFELYILNEYILLKKGKFLDSSNSLLAEFLLLVVDCEVMSFVKFDDELWKDCFVLCLWMDPNDEMTETFVGELALGFMEAWPAGWSE